MEGHEDYLSKLVWAIQWKEGYRSYSLILLSFWTLVCFHTLFVLYTLPLWTFILYHFNDCPVLNQSKQVLSLPSIHLSIRQFISLCITWTIMIYFIEFHKIIWLSATILLTWNHPIVKFTRDAYSRLHTPQLMKLQPLLPSPPPADKKRADQLDRYYRFVIIEHQRSWLGKWTTLLLPTERPEWSDEYLQKVPSIHSFILPPSTIRTRENNESIKTSWQWATQDWQIDYNRNVDKDGWEYGTWDWKSWASKSGLDIFTRRRYWIRNARLEQQSICSSKPVSIRSNTSFVEDNYSFSSSSVTSLDSSLSTPPSLITSLQKKSSLKSTKSLNSYSVEQHCTGDHIWLNR